MKYFLLLTFLFSLSGDALARKKAKTKRAYLSNFYAHLHKSPSKYSNILTTFECGQPCKVLESRGEFSKVKYSKYQGFVKSKFLTSRRPRDCWQDKYRKFFDNMDLSISQMYHWARLNDLLIEGEVMP